MSDVFLEAWGRRVDHAAGVDHPGEVRNVPLDEHQVAFLLAVEMRENPYGRGLHEEKEV